ncbi:MAG: phosphoribosylformylglycinamidine synthase II, partial [Nitrospinaceae bacterium]|nr:phosphoribosylformylglycinamidine synthase II [Nitrospinaceae bacterium]NIR55907.1 phosphoribosylformylglycinamidine synthase II [Nitrospinaceae bacterium]NIS86354.1 phosphoribosylformylglycinamidine synthase II [Nitrospinaceae bacterium]NIT83190.1 phosphoribosylformylglycinamidine synthase II [Nitrospinaceae bacterium]NIU45401.1 phosphoribosylformylglycinamidine synthase II [Nitrospinaceae bacterium]
LNLESTLRKDALVFGESQSRILISFPEKNRAALADLAQRRDIEFALLGTVGGGDFVINVNGREFIRENISVLQILWKNALGEYARQIA